MTVTVAGLPFQFAQQNSASGSTGFFFKSTKDAYLFNGTALTLTKVSDVDYPATTVPGVAYLDGYFFVMDANGTIYNSDLEAPLSWNPLNFINAQAEPDGGVGIAKYQNYVVGFGNWTTQLFYDAANASGSPLAPLTNATVQIGSANGYSAAQFDGKLVWMGNCREKGRGVYAFLGGIQPEKISTPDVDRILNADDLATVYSWGAGFAGHPLYVLSLGTSAVTLVYDFLTGVWSTFTRRKTASAKTATLSYDSATGLVTAASTAHGNEDGDQVVIAGATQSQYNGTFNITRTGADSFTYLPTTAPSVTPATGTITATGTTETWFDLTYYANAGGKDVVLGATDGIVYEVLGTAHQDNGVTIDTIARTALFDGGENTRKSVFSAELIGDKVAANALLRYSDDDYVTNSIYRPVDLSAKRSRVRRLGSMSRRSFEIRHTANTALRIESLELNGD